MLRISPLVKRYSNLYTTYFRSLKIYSLCGLLSAKGFFLSAVLFNSYSSTFLVCPFPESTAIVALSLCVHFQKVQLYQYFPCVSISRKYIYSSTFLVCPFPESTAIVALSLCVHFQKVQL